MSYIKNLPEFLRSLENCIKTSRALIRALGSKEKEIPYNIQDDVARLLTLDKDKIDDWIFGRDTNGRTLEWYLQEYYGITISREEEIANQYHSGYYAGYQRGSYNSWNTPRTVVSYGVQAVVKLTEEQLRLVLQCYGRDFNAERRQATADNNPRIVIKNGTAVLYGPNIAVDPYDIKQFVEHQAAETEKLKKALTTEAKTDKSGSMTAKQNMADFFADLNKSLRIREDILVALEIVCGPKKGRREQWANGRDVLEYLPVAENMGQYLDSKWRPGETVRDHLRYYSQVSINETVRQIQQPRRADDFYSSYHNANAYLQETNVVEYTSQVEMNLDANELEFLLKVYGTERYFGRSSPKIVISNKRAMLSDSTIEMKAEEIEQWISHEITEAESEKATKTAPKEKKKNDLIGEEKKDKLSFDPKTEQQIQKEITQNQIKKEENNMATKEVSKKSDTSADCTADALAAKVMAKGAAARAMIAEDAYEATKRLAVDEVTSLAHGALADLFVAQVQDPAMRDTIREQIVRTFASPQGAALFALMIGAVMTNTEHLVPEQFADVYNDIAREFRVNAHQRAGKMILEVVKPMIGTALVGLKGSLESVSKARSAMVAAQEEVDSTGIGVRRG